MVASALDARRATSGLAATAVADTLEETKKAEVEQKLPTEAALLATVTEKFYSSWAFKGLAAALVAGVGLAAGGIFLLGGQAYELSEKLDRKFNDGKAKLEATAQQAVQQHAEVLKTASEAVQSKMDQFGKQVDTATTYLEKEQRNFTETLKRDSVSRVAGMLHDDIASSSGPISESIVMMKSQLSALDKSINDIAQEVAAARDKLKVLSPILAPLESQAMAAGSHIKMISTAESQATKAKDDAEGARQAAISHRDEVRMILAQVFKSASEQQRTVDTNAGRLENLERSLASIEKTVTGVEAHAQKLGDLNQLLTQLQQADLIKRVHDLEEMNKSQPTQRQIENLSDQERCTLQYQLKALGFYFGDIDGNFGPGTRIAFSRYLIKQGDNGNAQLKPEHIAQLIDKVELRPCSSTPTFRRGAPTIHRGRRA
jgi:hypothetical protein